MTEPRDAAAVRMFPPGIPLLTIAAGVALNRVWPIDPAVTLPAMVRYWLGGAIVLGSFCLLGVFAVVLMRRSGQNESPWKPTPSILERGPYRFTRNPMYLQMLLVCIGVAVMMWNVWILLLTPLAWWMLQWLVIYPEEAYLERKFGDSYRAYQQRVRRWI